MSRSRSFAVYLSAFGGVLLLPAAAVLGLVTAGVPQAATVTVGLLSIAAAAGLAFALGRRLNAGMRELSTLQLRGADDALPTFPIRELEQIAQSLHGLRQELNATQLSLSDSNERYEALAESLPALVWLVKPDGSAAFQNRRVARYSGRPFEANRNARRDMVHPDDLAIMDAAREKGLTDRREYPLELRLRRYDGVYRWHRITTAPVELGNREAYWITTAIDIEELKQAQALQAELNAVLEKRVEEAKQQLREEIAGRQQAQRQLYHNQKIDAVSRLTGGIAHDLNNKLMVISANIDAAAKQLKNQPQLTRRLLAALVAADRAAGLISKLLTFAGQREWRAQYIDIAMHLRSLVELLERSFLSDSVQVELSIPQDLWSVMVDPDQLETAIVNLAVNARDAMPEGGVITIEARNVQLRAGNVPGNNLCGEFVQILVNDEGVGISPDHLERVFEPFFTTKSGKGPGLGLSQVHGFAMQLGGAVHIDSKIGEGTSVALYLPKADLPARVGCPPTLEDFVDDEETEASCGEILIVDDEVEVALALQGMIGELHYPTRIAIGPDEALEALKARRPSLVLTDVTMPGSMDGIALGWEIRRRFPGLPVVLITGNPTVIGGTREFPVVAKPITSRSLNAALQQNLAPANEGKIVPLFSEDSRRTS